MRIDVRVEARGADARLPLVDRQRLVAPAAAACSRSTHALVVPRGLPDLARIGVELVAPDAFEVLEWFGRGPHESYADRCVGAAVGRYAGTVDRHVRPLRDAAGARQPDGLRWLAVPRDRTEPVCSRASTGTCEGKATRYP